MNAKSNIRSKFTKKIIPKDTFFVFDQLKNGEKSSGPQAIPSWNSLYSFSQSNTKYYFLWEYFPVRFRFNDSLDIQILFLNP